MAIAKHLLLVAFAAALPTVALAQDAQVKFWLKGAPNNLQGCVAMDPQFTREHTFTLKGGQAEVTMPGNIHIKLKPVRPDVYAGDFELSRMKLNMLADLAATPKSLTITNRDIGCKWTAIKQ